MIEGLIGGTLLALDEGDSPALTVYHVDHKRAATGGVS